MSLPRYNNYVQPDNDWLGEIPDHWNVRRTKTMFSLQKSKIGKASADYTLLSLTLGGVVVRDMDGGGKFPAEFDDYQIVQKDDLVFCLFDIDETPRTIGIAHNHGMITGAYSVYRALPICVPEYACYYFLHLDSFKGLRPFYTGLRKVVRADTFAKVEMLAPPLKEQEQIASFLDYETAKIDALIEKQQQLIALLGEKRQAVISHAVTKGLNPDAPMRDSGVEWLGEVPEHWTTSRIGWLCPYLSYGFTNPMPTTDEGPHMLTAADISFEGVLYDTARRTSQSAFNDLSGKSKPLAGDVLVTKDGSLGRVTAYDGERPVCISQSVALLRPDTRVVDPKFLALALSGADYQSKMIFDAGGTTIKHIYISILAKMNFWFPGLDEQAKIVTAAAQRTDKMDELIDAATEAAELLRERRTALISAAVTGKIDVRGWKPPSSAAKSETEMEVA